MQKKKSKKKSTYNHDSHSITEACGVGKEKMNGLMRNITEKVNIYLTKTIKNSEAPKTSMLMEIVEDFCESNKLSARESFFVTSMIFQEISGAHEKIAIKAKQITEKVLAIASGMADIDKIIKKQESQ